MASRNRRRRRSWSPRRARKREQFVATLTVCDDSACFISTSRSGRSGSRPRLDPARDKTRCCAGCVRSSRHSAPSTGFGRPSVRSGEAADQREPRRVQDAEAAHRPRRKPRPRRGGSAHGTQPRRSPPFTPPTLRPGPATGSRTPTLTPRAYCGKTDEAPTLTHRECRRSSAHPSDRRLLAVPAGGIRSTRRSARRSPHAARSLRLRRAAEPARRSARQRGPAPRYDDKSVGRGAPLLEVRR